MKSHLLLIFAYVLVIFSCDKKDDITQQTNSILRVRNDSKYTITDVSIFSIPIGNLETGETSEYKSLNFNKREDDPMIYLTVGNDSFAKYIFPDSTGKKYTYIIDSIQLQSKSIFLHKIEE